MIEYLKKVFSHLPALQVEDLGSQVGKLKITHDVSIGQVVRFQERGLIINKVDLNPSCNIMLEWVTKNFF